MKNLILISLVFLGNFAAYAQSVAINNDASLPNASAMLDIKSITKGLLIPRMTTLQRTAIAAPAKGLIVFDITTNGLWFHNGTAWNVLSSGSATNYWTATGSDIYNNNAGKVGIGIINPSSMLSILSSTINAANNTDILQLTGKNPLQNFSSELGTSVAYIKGVTDVSTTPQYPVAGLEIGALPNNSLYLSTNYGPTVTITSNNNVGIGTTNPLSKLHIIGAVKIDATNAIEFGAGLAKELNAGKIGYQTFTTDALDIVGAGTTGLNRKIKFWNEGGAVFTGNIGIGYPSIGVPGYMLSTNGGAYINGPLVTTGNVEIQGEIVGYVGINTATAHYPLEVHDFGSAPIQDYAYYALAHNSSFQPTENIGGAQSGADVSIYASNRVLASEFNAFSDARIKNIKGISNTTKDLATINALEITDYTLKDKIKNGNKSFKKVIAQQVEKVYPEVVSKHVDFIPNVYQLTNKIEKISNGYLLSFKNNHSISDTAKKLQLLLQDGKSMKQFEIVSIPSSNSVIIKATDLKADKIFVYGEEVNDFRTVDYEGLTTLNISATQELSKLVKAQQTAMEAQDKKIEMLIKEIELLKGKNLTALQAKQ